jgi:hypothetical protein
MAIVEAISGVPDVLRGFVYWLIFINTASVFFVLHRPEARWVLGVWAALVLLGMGLAEREIAPRFIAATTTAIWTPLVVWLVWRNPIEMRASPGAPISCCSSPRISSRPVSPQQTSGSTRCPEGSAACGQKNIALLDCAHVAALALAGETDGNRQLSSTRPRHASVCQ